MTSAPAFADYIARVVQYDPLRASVEVVLGFRQGDGTGVYVTGLGQEGRLESRPAGEMAPTLSIPDSAARALLDALAQYYGGTGDSRQLRKDYDAERSRVDRLTEALISIATAPPVTDVYEVSRG